MECPELPAPNTVQSTKGTNPQDPALLVSVPWGEEERRNVAAFFTLLDQWDRELDQKRQVA